MSKFDIIERLRINAVDGSQDFELSLGYQYVVHVPAFDGGGEVLVSSVAIDRQGNEYVSEIVTATASGKTGTFFAGFEKVRITLSNGLTEHYIELNLCKNVTNSQRAV